MKILFCNDVDVGGSANYVYNMADECINRGHDVKVLHMTDDLSVLDAKWDLVIVHGMTGWQYKCIRRAHPNKLLWLAIRPTYTEDEYKALEICDYVGCSTHIDYHFAGYTSSKVKKVRHGIPVDKSQGVSGFKEKYGIKGRMFFSAGGYGDNKDMHGLIDMFKEAELKDITLVTTGYSYEDMHMYESNNVICLHDIPHEDVLNGMYEAELYISNAYSEGFGLCLLESMANKTPWLAKDGWYGDEYHVGAVKDLVGIGTGFSYTTKEQFIHILQKELYLNIDTERNFNIVSSEYDIKNTVDNIEKLLPLYNTYCINIPKRPDRLEMFQTEAERAGLNDYTMTTDWPKNLNGIDITSSWLKENGYAKFDWQIDSDNRWWSRPLTKGELGCMISHTEIWHRSKGHTLILEDDVVFTENWKVKLHNAIETLNVINEDWDLLYLGRVPQNDSEIRVTDNLVKPKYTFCTYAYMLSPRGLNRIKEYNVEQGLIPADEFLTATYHKHPRDDVSLKYPPTLSAYAIEPHIVLQRDKDEAGSDTEK